MQIFLTVVGFVLSFASAGIYISGIVRGKIKPHLYTHLIWSIVTMIAFLGSLVSGGGYGAWIIGVTGLLTIIISIFSFKYGTKDIKPIDKLFLCGALIAIIPWIVFKDPFWSVVLAVVIDMCGYFPTIRKTWKTPSSEMLLPWSIGSIKFFIAIITLRIFNITTILFPAEMLMMNMVVVSVIILRRFGWFD